MQSAYVLMLSLTLTGCAAAPTARRDVTPAELASGYTGGTGRVECAWTDVHCAIALPYPELVAPHTATSPAARDYRRLLVQAAHRLQKRRRFKGQKLDEICADNPSASYIYALNRFAASQKPGDYAGKLRMVLDAMAQTEAKIEPANASDSPARELERRVSLDQLWAGQALFEFGDRFGSDDDLFNLAYAFLVVRRCAGDRDNAAWLDRIFDSEGWPSKARYGKGADNGAWLIAQHADFDPRFQLKALKLLRQAVAKGEGDPSRVGLLIDRYRVNKGRRQLYGTQYRAICGGNRPWPIAKPESLDARRRQLGLEPWAEYDKKVGRPCKGGKNDE